MRWFWIDRFEVFERGKRAVAIKNVSVAEEHLNDPVSGIPHLHESLIVEGLAQAGGLLISESFAFEKRLVLAKVSKAEFNELAMQGEQLQYTVDVERIGADGASIHGQCHLDGRLVGEIDLFFAYLDDRFPKQLFNPGDLLTWVVAARMYDVGVDENGDRIEIPDILKAGTLAE